MSFDEIEKMPLAVLFDLEVVDSKIEAAFEEKRGKNHKKKTPKVKRRLEDFI